MILYTDEFLDDLPKDPKLALHLICETFLRTSQGALDVALEFYALAETYISVNQLSIKMPELSNNRKEKADAIYQFAVRNHKDLERFVELNKDQLKLEEYRSRFSLRIANNFAYEFTVGDLNRVKIAIEELLNLVSSSPHLENAHKKRLLTRLQSVKSNLQKRMFELDHFWGLIGDAGVIIAKLGDQSTNIIDRIKDISNIVWQTQARAEELSSNSKTPISLLLKTQSEFVEKD